MHWLSGLAGLAQALNCKKLGLEYLDQTFEMVDTISTPPSQTERHIYFNPCSPVKIDGCAEDDHFCVLVRATVDGKTLLTEVRNYGSNAAGAKERLYPTGLDGLITIQYEGAKWGDRELAAQVDIRCGQADNTFETMYGQVLSTIGQGKICEDQPENPGDSKDPEDPPSKKKPSEPKKGGWGLFTYSFLFSMLGVVVYAASTVYVNFAQSKGNLPSAADIGDILRDLPYLIRDAIRKVKSGFSTQSRSGYSAS